MESSFSFDLPFIIDRIALKCNGARTSEFQSIPATCAPETRFCPQCAHWGQKQSLPSVGRPEIPENFRPAQASSHALKSRPADFQR
jgi:hypothetical protein